jgi:hypothetical protein
VLRAGGTTAAPAFLADLAYIDFTLDSEFDDRFKELVRAIFRAPECVPPPLGPMPTFHQADPLYVRPDEPVRRDVPADPTTAIRMENRPRPLDPLHRLERQYGERPFYAIWAWPTGLAGSLLDTQDSKIQAILRNPPGRREDGYTLAYFASHATIVQEGLRFSSSYQTLDLSDGGSMVFSSSLEEFVRDERLINTIHPLPLIEYTVSFVQCFSALWSANCASKSLEPSTVRFAVRICLHNAVGWELRPGKPGTGGYDHLYDIDSQRQPIASKDLFALSTEAHNFDLPEPPDLLSLALLRSIYSAFGYTVDDIPYLDPKRLTFIFQKGNPS